MNDTFTTLRSAVQKFLAQSEMPVESELTDFRNAASVLTIDKLLRSYDAAVRELARMTQDGPLGALSADEVRLISIHRVLGEQGRDTMMTAAEVAADVYGKSSDMKRADVVELRPKK